MKRILFGLLLAFGLAAAFPAETDAALGEVSLETGQYAYFIKTTHHGSDNDPNADFTYNYSLSMKDADGYRPHPLMIEFTYEPGEGTNLKPAEYAAGELVSSIVYCFYYKSDGTHRPFKLDTLSEGSDGFVSYEHYREYQNGSDSNSSTNDSMGAFMSAYYDRGAATNIPILHVPNSERNNIEQIVADYFIHGGSTSYVVNKDSLDKDTYPPASGENLVEDDELGYIYNARAIDTRKYEIKEAGISAGGLKKVLYRVAAADIIKNLKEKSPQAEQVLTSLKEKFTYENEGDELYFNLPEGDLITWNYGVVTSASVTADIELDMEHLTMQDLVSEFKNKRVQVRYKYDVIKRQIIPKNEKVVSSRLLDLHENFNEYPHIYDFNFVLENDFIKNHKPTMEEIYFPFDAENAEEINHMLNHYDSGDYAVDVKQLYLRPIIYDEKTGKYRCNDKWVQVDFSDYGNTQVTAGRMDDEGNFIEDPSGYKYTVDSEGKIKDFKRGDEEMLSMDDMKNIYNGNNDSGWNVINSFIEGVKDLPMLLKVFFGYIPDYVIWALSAGILAAVARRIILG